MKGKRTKKLVIVKIFIVICVVLLLALIGHFLRYELYRFPIDALSNYPDTEWKCDKLGLEMSVDESGKISGICTVDDESILLDVTAHTATTYHSNYMQCFNRADDAEVIFLNCFYRDINDGIFYVIVDSTGSTLDLNAVADIVPYRFEKQ